MKIMRFICVLLCAFCSMAWGQNHPGLPQTAVVDQFASPQTPPFPNEFFYDRVQGEMVNFETILLKPIMVTHNGGNIVVLNDAEGTVTVLTPNLGLVAEIPVGQGPCAVAEPLEFAVVVDPDQEEEPQPGDEVLVSRGQLWVTVRHQMSVVVIDMATWTVVNVLRPPVSSTVAGARFADSPSGLAFNHDYSKAYVSSFNTDHLIVYDVANQSWLRNIPLQWNHKGRNTFMNEPNAVISHRGAIYVSSYRSGNNTLAINTVTPNLPMPTWEMVDLATFTTVNGELPDFDVMKIDTSSDTVSGVFKGAGTVLNNMASIGGQNKIFVSNTDAQNTLLGEPSFPGGRVAINQLSILDLNTNTMTPVPTEDMGPLNRTHLVQPTGMVVDDRNRIFVAGYGSANIGVFDHNGNFLGSMPSHSGPFGLAYHRGFKRLYAFNRAENSVTAYDLAGASLPASWMSVASGNPFDPIALTDPTYDTVKEGRKIFLDPTNSGDGTASCASCHLHNRNDGSAFNLSGYYDTPAPYTVANPPLFWKDHKGVMQTQDLRSLRGVPGYHWRGEQEDLDAFNDAFVGLLQGTKLSESDFAKMKEYIFNTVYPANPFQQMNRNLSGVGTNEKAKAGLDVFLHDQTDGNLMCVSCHAIPTGTDAGQTDGQIQFLDQNTPIGGAPDVVIKTAQLRGMWTKTPDLAVWENAVLNPPLSLAAMTGVGFFHSGANDSSDDFLTTFFSGVGATKQAQLQNLMDEWDSGVPPAAHWMEILDVNNPTAGSFPVAQANGGHIDVAVRGWVFNGVSWDAYGLVYDPNTQLFTVDDSVFGAVTLATLQSTVAAGAARWLIMGVPLGSGSRIGVDRDRDGVLNRDEVAGGTDPVNPDTDGDGYWDGYDPNPTTPETVAPSNPSPAIVPGSLTVEWATTNSIKITYQTDTYSPTRIAFGPSGGPLNRFEGDPMLPIPSPPALPTATSNLWKRYHTVFIRKTEEGVPYDWQIITQGQNGFSTLTPVFTDATLADVVNGAMVVTDVTCYVATSGGQQFYRADVTLEDGHGNPVSGANVRGHFTTITGGVPVAQTNAFFNSATPFVAAVTNASGVATLSIPVPAGHVTGDGVKFDVPMHVLNSSGFWIPAVDDGLATPLSNFLWSESPNTHDEVNL